ncbi:hypothetical protein HYH02_004910 [Chlamydomonas schloesseri]|uniref:Prostaglandin E synthase 2 n=1 Tax=Chlamydomonas schloesseri TaxID=2026947 RepID=A0A835WND9_9CHLO|nr:hypothetical protein HYH02_004910 [Chlamydomonas schloesseri]|eukprot:KAG2450408.1 hypothetical protein HYH02_004910 [Chlamydomonas schloesseri]
MSSALRRLAPTLLYQTQTRAAVLQSGASTRFLAIGAADQPHANPSGGRQGVLAAAAALLGVGAVTASATLAAADAPATPVEVAADPYARPGSAHPLPAHVTLYQYEVCPYCCKVRAMLDYYKLPYTVIEVNPLTKGELSWSSYKKVPVVKLDEEVVVDSSAIMSRLAVDVAAAGRDPLAAKAPPPPPAKKASSGGGGWFGGSSSSGGADAGAGAKDQAAGGAGTEAAMAEEVRWRKWVDEKLVKILTANIYRNWDESVETFKYITDQTGWSWGTREVARWTGAVMMWQIGKRMPAKYGIEGDLRVALYDTANDFVDGALAGGSKRFAGGERPNLADLAAFGVIRAVRQTGAFRDLMANSRIAPWFAAMEEAVGGSARVATTGAKSG